MTNIIQVDKIIGECMDNKFLQNFLDFELKDKLVNNYNFRLLKTII